MAETLNLENIYLFDGANKGDWEFFVKDITNESFCEKIVSSLSENLIKQPKNELNLDIIDYILNFGCQKIINLIGQKEFLDNVLNLVKAETNAGLEIQKKVIYLTQKWAKKFANNNDVGGFQENYNILKSFGISFPDDSFVMDTYNKYIGDSQPQQNASQQPQPQSEDPSQQNNPNENNQINNQNQINPQPLQQDGFPSNENYENNNNQPPSQDNLNDDGQNKNENNAQPINEDNNNNVLRSTVPEKDKNVNNQNFNQNNKNDPSFPQNNMNNPPNFNQNQNNMNNFNGI